MTVSGIASILVKKGVKDVPCVYYLTLIRYPKGMPGSVSVEFWKCTVPDGMKLVVYKAGIASGVSSVVSHEETDTLLIISGADWYEYTGPYNELNLEFSSGATVSFNAYNKGTEKSHFGVWVLFDFEPE